MISKHTDVCKKNPPHSFLGGFLCIYLLNDGADCQLIFNNIKEIIDNNSKNDLGYKEIIGCFGVKSSEVFYDPTTKNLIKQNNYHRATGLSGRNLEDFDSNLQKLSSKQPKIRRRIICNL